MTAKRIHYVYIYSCRGVPFYVGKGVGSRFTAHVEREDFPDLNDVTISFETFDSNEEALGREAALIRALGLRSAGGVLINKVVPQVYSTTINGDDEIPTPSEMPLLKNGMTPIVFSVQDTCKALTISRPTLYKLIGARKLNAKKMGSRTVILADDLRAYMSSLSNMRPMLPS